MAKIYNLGTTWIKRFKDDTCIVVMRRPQNVYVGIVYKKNIYEVDSKLDIYDALKCRDTYNDFINRYRKMKREDAYKLVSGNPCSYYMEGDKVNDALLSVVDYVNGHILKENLEDDVTDED